MNKIGLVSIIIPTYNCEKYIEEAVKSCINQTYKNIEILVIDDGSTDNTKEVLKEYIDSNKIKYIYQKNSERSTARNNGLDNAKGEYIQFLDSDDILKVDKIEKSINIFEKDNDIFAVYTGTEYFNDNSNEIIYVLQKKIWRNLERQLLIKGNIFPIQSLLIKKTDVRFDLKLNIMEDYKFWIEVLKNKKIYSLKEELSKVRVHDTNTSYNSYLMEENRIKVAIEYITKNQIKDKIIKILLLALINKNERLKNKYEKYFKVSLTEKIMISIILGMKKIKRLIIKKQDIYE